MFLCSQKCFPVWKRVSSPFFCFSVLQKNVLPIVCLSVNKRLMIFPLSFPPTAGTCPYPNFLTHLLHLKLCPKLLLCSSEQFRRKLRSSFEGHQTCSHCNGINKQLINSPCWFTSALSWWILSTVPCRALSWFAVMESLVAANLSEVITAFCSSFSSLSRLSTCTCALASSIFFWKQENRLLQCTFFHLPPATPFCIT